MLLHPLYSIFFCSATRKAKQSARRATEGRTKTRKGRRRAKFAMKELTRTLQEKIYVKDAQLVLTAMKRGRETAVRAK